MSTERLLSIGEVAERAGRRASAIRYYEQVGLLSRPVRIGGRRMYDAGVVGTLALIETAQRAGLTLEEIRLVRQGDTVALRAVAARKLPEVRAEIERAELAREWLECAARCDCPSVEECPLFEAA
jgi:MerR family transcriptional regulator, redox-sensitive transcriptional activator SoxR